MKFTSESLLNYFEKTLGDTVERNGDVLFIKTKKLRFCIECGREHDTGIENRITGEFENIDKCIDCLMSKYYINIIEDKE